MSALYSYDDAHNHRLTIAATTDGLSQPYVSLGADCMDIGGDMANVWLPVADAERLAVALAGRAPFEHTDHMGDMVTVAPAPDWTTFTVVRAACDDGETPVSVRVVVLSARLWEVRAGLVAALPVPVGPEPQALPLSGPICSEAEARAAGLDIAPSVEELDAMASTIVAAGDPLSAEVSLAQAVPLLSAAVTGLRAWVAELETERTTVFRASHDSIVMGHYTTRQAAMDHVHGTLANEEGGDVAARVIWRADDPEADEPTWECWLFDTDMADDSPTGYVVTPVEVASEYDAEADE